MPVQKSGKSAKATRWKRLLGKTAGEITRVMGVPFVAYNYRDEEIYLYDSKPATTIAFRKGLVVRCNDTRETRRAVRVRPARDIDVIVRGEGTLRGHVKDISVAGAAVLHTDESSFPLGSRVELSLVLPIDGSYRLLRLTCRLRDARSLPGYRMSVLQFDLTNSPGEKRLLSRYVLLRKTQEELGLKHAQLFTPSLIASLGS